MSRAPLGDDDASFGSSRFVWRTPDVVELRTTAQLRLFESAIVPVGLTGLHFCLFGLDASDGVWARMLTGGVGLLFLWPAAMGRLREAAEELGEVLGKRVLDHRSTRDVIVRRRIDETRHD